MSFRTDQRPFRDFVCFVL